MDKEQYVAALRGSVAEFEELRKQDSTRNIDLSGADLSGLDLRKVQLASADLSNVSFEDSDLTGAVLRFAKLAGTRFNGAKLVDIVLHHADMEGADFRGAVLGGFEADSQMCLRGCNFKGVRWSREHLEYFLGVLNQNDDWEIRFQVLPKAS